MDLPLNMGQQRTSTSRHSCRWIILLCFLTTIFIAPSEQAVYPQQPKVNACDENGQSDTCVCNIGDVRCINLNPKLLAVPMNIPSNVKALGLSQNNILQIEEYDFTGLERLESIFLQDNNISYIHPYAFRALYRLKILNLERNKLTQLDPKGTMFQYLASMQILAAQQNNIYYLKGYSFFSMVRRFGELTVKFTDNPVMCDCSVRAIRDWVRNYAPQGSIYIDGLKCANDPQKRPYDQVEDALFGSCNGNSSEDVFESGTECPICAGERTHHGCLLQRREPCIGINMVCRQTVIWNNQDLSISSSCDSYSQCLSLQDNVNKASCGLDFQGNGNFNCVFCCVGPTCQQDSIGGRVVDYTVYLTYVRNDVAFQSYMNDSGSPQYLQEEQRIDIGVRNTLDRLKGGVDAYVIAFEPMPNRQLKVKLRLEVTTLNTFTMSDVLQTINKDIKSSIDRPSSFFYLDGVIHIVISSTPSDSDECPRDTTTHPTKGSITWQAVFLDTTTSETKYSLCPYQIPFATSLTFASRTCALNVMRDAEWGPVDYSDCVTKEEQDNADTSPIFTKPILESQARNVSAFLLKYTNNYEKMTPERLNNVVNALEQLTEGNMLQQPEVVSNVMGCLNNLLNVDDEVLRESHDETSTSKRLLKVIDNVAELAPLEAGNKLKVVTPNIAVAAQGISRSETRDVTFTANTAAGEDLESNQINVGFQSGTRPPSPDGSTMVIPTKALIDSLAPEDQSRMERMSFAVHGTDKLFASMSEDEKDRTRIITEPPPSFADDEGVDVVDDSKEDALNDGSKTEKPPKEKSFTVVRKVNSHVISASVPGVEVKDLDDNVTMTFEHEDDNATNAQCVYWEEARKGGEGRWSSEGCGIVETSEGKTTCGCNHLTNFALLMDVYQEGSTLSDLDRKILSIISYVGCGISLFALILTLLTYSLFRKLRRDNPSKILINLCLALLLSNLVFLVGMHEYAFQTTASCKAVAVLLHYFLLASLSWMAVEAFYMYLALVLVFKTYFTNFILKCSLVGWGVPLVIVVATLAINTTDNYGFINSGLCWLKNPAFYAAFVAPVCLILLVNCLAFGLVVKQLMSMSSTKLNKTDRNSTVQRLRGAVGVVILLGLSWLFAIFAIDQASVVFYYLFAIFNSLQGLFIFIFYCLLKKDAMTAWKRSLPCCDEYGESSKTSSNSKAAYQTATAHHMTKNNANSGSSTSMNNTASTNSTAADSRKNSSSYFNSVSSANVYSNITEEDPDEGHQYKKTGSYDVTPSSTRQTEPHTYYNMGYEEKNSDTEPTKAGYPDPGSEEPKDTGVSPPKTKAALIPPQSSPQPYTFNIDTASDRQPTPASYNYLSNSNKASPASRPRAQGEIDYSRPEGVNRLRLRYERTNSDTSDLEVTRI